MSEMEQGSQDVQAPAPAAVAPPAMATAGVDTSRIEVILDIDLPLRTLTQLGPGSVIDLGRSPDEPVDVMVSNRVVARGEVVIVGGNYGIRIIDVVSPSERMPWVEA